MFGMASWGVRPNIYDFPERGHQYRKEPEGDIRVLLFGHYRIAYILTDEFIDILCVFHGALDIERYIP